MKHTVELVHHSANREHSFVSGSLNALRHCIQQSASIIEIDITPTADGHWALLHNATLEGQATGSGRVDAHTAQELGHMKLLANGNETAESVGFLCDALNIVAEQPFPTELQLDLKANTPLTMTRLEGLIRICEPLMHRIRITSVADWALRRLERICPGLNLGFDPLAFLDTDNGSSRNAPPFRIGAYGYHDEHPLASSVWGSPSEYLATRAEILFDQAPSSAAWYIRATMLSRALGDGFDWIAFLHQRGVMVDTWTLDNTRSSDLALIDELVGAGIDRITTNTAPSLASRSQNITRFSL